MSFGRGSSLTDLRLYCSLSLHPEYSNFRTTLKGSLKLLDQPTLSTTGNESIDAALGVLWTERKTEKGKEKGKGKETVAEVKTVEGGKDPDEICDDIKASATDQDENMVEAAQLQALVDDARAGKAIEDAKAEKAMDDEKAEKAVDGALKILVHNATEEFGFTPRDVYEGVFDLAVTKHHYAKKVDGLEYSQLKSIAEAFIKKGELDDISDHVVVVRPCEGTIKEDGWQIDFKSTRIKWQVMEAMQLAEDRHLRETLKLLNGINGASGLAGTVFEAIVHRTLSGGWRDANYMPQPTRMMAPDKSKPLALSTESSTPSTSLPPCALLRAKPRTPSRVAFTHEFSDVALDGSRYYTSTSAAHPFFDSFIVDFVEPRTAVISVLQITISPRHGGSAEDYMYIRKLMMYVRKLLEKKLLEKGLPEQEPPKKRSKQEPPSTTVKVVYFLVCSESDNGSQRQWDMPAGWDDDAKVNDHRGEVYCIRIPTSVRHGMSCAFNPNFAPY
jgi:hypothetical protein